MMLQEVKRSSIFEMKLKSIVGRYEQMETSSPTYHVRTESHSLTVLFTSPNVKHRFRFSSSVLVLVITMQRRTRDAQCKLESCRVYLSCMTIGGENVDSERNSGGQSLQNGTRNRTGKACDMWIILNVTVASGRCRHHDICHSPVVDSVAARTCWRCARLHV